MLLYRAEVRQKSWLRVHPIPLGWSQTSGPAGTIVDRIQVERVSDITPGGAAQAVAAVPYYRDDSCFDDGTGADPGPRLRPVEGDEPRTGRRCWQVSDGTPQGTDPTFFQGSIATHGPHLLFVAESDNARLTVPLTEIVAEQRMVMLPGDPAKRRAASPQGEATHPNQCEMKLTACLDPPPTQRSRQRPGIPGRRSRGRAPRDPRRRARAV